MTNAVFTLEDLFHIQGRIGWKGYTRSDLVDHGPIVIGGREVKSTFQLDLKEVKHLSQVKFLESPEIMLQHNDLLVVCRGNLADVGIYREEYGKGTLNPSVVLLRRKSENQINPTFAFYLLSSKLGRHSLMSIASGSSVPAIYQSSLKKLSFTIPPIQEQKAIAEVLSSLDDKIELLQKQNETLEALAQTLFRQWYIEEADDTWEECTVGRFAEIIKTSVKPEANPDKTFEHYSLPAYDNQQNPSLDLGIDIKSNKYKVINESVLISKLNPGTSRVWLVLDEAQENSICSTEFVVVKPDSKEWLFYIYCLLSSNDTSEYLGSCASGTSGSHQRIKPIDVLNINFSFNNIDSIRRFGLHVQPLFEKISMNRKSIRTLEQTRDTLLPKLMSGQVRVKLD